MALYYLCLLHDVFDFSVFSFQLLIGFDYVSGPPLVLVVARSGLLQHLEQLLLGHCCQVGRRRGARPTSLEVTLPFRPGKNRKIHKTDKFLQQMATISFLSLIKKCNQLQLQLTTSIK